MTDSYNGELGTASLHAVLALASICLGLFVFVYQYISRDKKREVGSVSLIRLYPLKSGPWIDVERAELTPSGLRYGNIYDRQFILVNPSGSYITSKSNLKFLDLTIRHEEKRDSLLMSAPGQKDLQLSLYPKSYNSSNADTLIWYDERQVYYVDCGDAYAEWFTELLGESCRLGYYHPDLPCREIPPEDTINKPTNRNPDSRIFYNSSHPYLICTQASLDDLNNRLDEKVGFERFRPNLVVKANDTVEPYEEDDWREIGMGSGAKLFGERQCVRCMRIYIDHQRKCFHPKKEPMTTLLKYRRGPGKDKYKTVFGINASLVHAGSVQIGDSVCA